MRSSEGSYTHHTNKSVWVRERVNGNYVQELMTKIKLIVLIMCSLAGTIMCSSTDTGIYRRSIVHVLAHVTISSTCCVEKYMCLHWHTRKYNIYIRSLLFLHVYIGHWETPFIGYLNRYTHISRTHFAHICVRILSYMHINTMSDGTAIAREATAVSMIQCVSMIGRWVESCS